jgi:hypothetical protein
MTTVALAEMMRPCPREFWSSNKRFVVKVTPSERQDQAGNCRAVLFEVKGTNWVERWSRYLPNNQSPSLVFVSDNAEFILSIGDWSESSRTLPVVVYQENRLICSHTLESLGIESIGNMVDPFNWGDGAKLFFGPRQETFIIVLKTGHPVVIDKQGDVWGPYQSNQKERDEVLSHISANTNSAKSMLQYIEESYGR